jgi:hypothetical protein
MRTVRIFLDRVLCPDAFNFANRAGRFGLYRLALTAKETPDASVVWKRRSDHKQVVFSACSSILDEIRLYQASKRARPSRSHKVELLGSDI